MKVRVRSHYSGGKFYGGGAADQMVRWWRGKRDAIENGNRDAIERIMEEAADLMRYYITSRGARTSGPGGRYETGHMYDSVKSEVRNWGPNKIEGRFGWLDTQEDYFGYQEAGFHHGSYAAAVGAGQDDSVDTRKWIEGMYAQQDAADWAIREVEEAIRRNVRNA